jgi:hypothetical protein
MPVLLLSRGDSQGKDLLRRAIEARYGFAPPALETLKLHMKGRVLSRIGGFQTWLSLEADVYFRLPLAQRREYRLRFAGIPVRSGSDSFDSMVYRQNDQVITNPQAVATIQAQTWALSALLLMPLTESHVEILTVDERTIEATHTETDDHAVLHLNDAYMVERVTTKCFNLQTGQEALFVLGASKQQTTLSNLILPAKVTLSWAHTPFMEVQPISAVPNAPLADSLFGGGDD